MSFVQIDSMPDRIKEIIDRAKSEQNTSFVDIAEDRRAENRLDDDLSKKDLNYKQMLERLTTIFDDKFFIQNSQV